MSLPSDSDLAKLSYTFQGQPFARISSKGQDTDALDYTFQGQPLRTNFSSYTRTVSGTTSGAGSAVASDSTSGTASGSGSVTADGSILKVSDGTASGSGSVTGSQGVNGTATGSGSVSSAIQVTGSTSGSGSAAGVVSSLSLFTVNYSVKAVTRSYIDVDYSTTSKVQAYYASDFSTNAAITVSDLVPTTSITASGNVFDPTIVVNGTYVSEHSSTSSGISDLANTCLFIGIKNAGMTNTSLCDLETFSMSFNDQGGSWNITSLKNNLGICNDQVTIYDFRGTIKSPGWILSTGRTGYEYSGIFGNPNLFTPFRWLVANSPMETLLSNQFNAVIPTENWTTASAAIFGIASKVGTTVQWLIRDVPISDFKMEEGSTAMSAMSSLAERAGGVLRWNGDNSWIVVYPDHTRGIWEIPSCDLILPGGLKYSPYCDAIDPRGIIAGSLPANQDVGTQQAPSDGKPQVRLITKVKGPPPTDSDPDAVFDLSPNYDKVYCQILVPQGGNVTGSNLVSLHNWITESPTDYFLYDAAVPGEDYVFVTNIGGVLTNQVKYNYKCFPQQDSNNEDINNGNYYFSIYETIKDLPAPTTNNISAQQLLSMTQNNYRYVKTADYQIECLFFGSIPLPGMLGKVSVPNVKIYVPDCNGSYTTIDIGTLNIEAIIESVTFTSPGYLTVNLSTYKKIFFYNTQRINYGT